MRTSDLLECAPTESGHCTSYGPNCICMRTVLCLVTITSRSRIDQGLGDLDLIAGASGFIGVEALVRFGLWSFVV